MTLLSGLAAHGRPPAPRLRSLLFCPADRPERVAKAVADGKADCVVADLEDGVTPDHKVAARAQALEALQATSQAKTLRGVRINSWASGLAQEDLEGVMPGRPDIVALAKAESPHEVRELSTLVGQLEGRLGFANGSTRIVLHVETAVGILSARELAAASPRVVAIAFGAEDLAADMGLRRTRSNQEVHVARGMVALSAAATGVMAIDMICADPRDLERTAQEAAEARSLGFAGKMCIHPMQAVAVHEAFRPSDEEVAWARRVVEAAEAAGAEEGGIVMVDGRMVDVPFVRQARRILRDAE